MRSDCAVFGVRAGYERIVEVDIGGCGGPIELLRVCARGPAKGALMEL